MRTRRYFERLIFKAKLIMVARIPVFVPSFVPCSALLVCFQNKSYENAKIYVQGKYSALSLSLSLSLSRQRFGNRSAEISMKRERSQILSFPTNYRDTETPALSEKVKIALEFFNQLSNEYQRPTINLHKLTASVSQKLR